MGANFPLIFEAYFRQFANFLLIRAKLKDYEQEGI